MFFSFDGIDGVGKSTQIELFVNWLEQIGHDVVRCRDPGSTPAGEAIREILLNHKNTAIHLRTEMLLYMAARTQLVEEVIRPALDAGKTVVSDRFLLANVVYQGHAAGLGADLLWRVGEIATAGVKPDLTILLDMETKRALARIPGEPDRMEQRGFAFLDAVRQGFLAEATRLPEEVVVIDAGGEIEQIHGKIQAAASRILEAKANE